MNRLWQRWIEGLASRTPTELRQLHLLALSMVLYLVHITWFSTWQIEDAAITYAFARNAAIGEGFVANPGGAWVEGFSNPVWTLLLTATTWLGLPVFGMGKVLGGLSGLLTLALSLRWARRLQGPDEESLWPALAPLVLALSGPFALWSVAGLENGLFNLFLAAGVVWILEEGDTQRFPRSAIPLGLLALSRPDGPMYAGMITLLLAPRAVRMGGMAWGAGFLLLSGGPFLAWHSWSYWAFGWELPNTAYAKDPSSRSAPWRWSHRSWTYLRAWALASTHGFLFPIFVYGLTGLRGWRVWMGNLALALGVAITLPGLGWLRAVLPLPDEPKGVMMGRIVIYGLVVLLLLIANIKRPGWNERGVAAVLVVCTLVFCVLTGGDWMRGFRWISLATVPLAVLAAEGARTVADALVERGWTRWWFDRSERIAGLLVLPLLIAGIGQTIDVLYHIDTAPFDVQRRALYHRALADRMHIDHVTHVEIDMGGNMFSSGFELLDIAGLIDVPIAHHGYQRRFIDQYIGREKRPLLVHIHGGWETKSKVVKSAWFRQGWISVPGYAHTSRVWHLGTYVRKDAFVWKSWPHSDGRQARFGRLVLSGLHLPAPEVHPGGELFVELGWTSMQGQEPFRALFFLVRGDQLVVKDLPPAYDWIPTKDWKPKKIYSGRYSIELPPDLEEGSYSIGMVVVSDDADPHVIQAQTSAAEATFLRGEVRWEGVVEVVSREEAQEKAASELAEAIQLAEARECLEAEEGWVKARRHLARKDVWQGTARPQMEAALATCWALRAAESGPPNTAFDSPPREAALQIQKARRLDHHAPEVERVSQVLADRWEEEGNVAEAKGDTTGVWRGWRDALIADPSRSRLRRKLEAVRTTRLKLKK